MPENEELSTLEQNSTEVAEEEAKSARPAALDKGRFFKNVFVVLASNIISILSGILVGFVIPKILGVSEYGYYKTYTLYCSYIGIFHFGFIDGIYLKYAGKKYDELDYMQFRTYTRFLVIMEVAISCIALLVALPFLKGSYRWILFFVAANVIVTNMVSYYEFVGQITMKFKQVSIKNIIRCVLNIIVVSVLYVLYRYYGTTIFAKIYIAISLVIGYLLLGWYLVSVNKITFGKAYPIKSEKSNIKYLFKIGFPLLLANLIGQLVFVADQQVVNIAFSNETYSTYAFAYNMINLITVATSAISVVFYPTIKSMDADAVTNNYSRINAYLLMFVALCLTAYFVMDVFVRAFLDKYVESLIIFRVILPGVMISSSISVIKYNCYKRFEAINNYFIKSVIILALSIAANVAVYLIFKNTISISIVSIFVLLVWYIIVEFYFVKRFNVKWKKNLLYLLSILTAFYLTILINNIYIAMVVYMVSFAAITLAFYYGLVKNLAKALMKKLKRNKGTVNE